MTYRIGSLCSGYEGLGMAVQSVLGGELAWVADNDPGAAMILAHRFPDVPNHGDIKTADCAAAEPVDILTAGFPCQPVSAAGRRKGTSDERWLWDDIAAAVGRMGTRPRLLLLENVAGLLTANGGDAMARVVHGLAALGYECAWRVVRASDVGAPHRRERIFILGWPAADTASQRRAGQRRPVAAVQTAPTSEPPRRHPDVAAPAPHPDGAAGGQRRLTAPGQTQAGWSRADAGRRGRAPAADTPGDGRDQGRTEPARLIRRPDAAVSGATTADAYGNGLARGQERDCAPQRSEANNIDRRVDPQRRVLDWGIYAPAIGRWESVTGRPAPRPTEPGRTGERLSPRFVEFLMGLPEGWVTDVPGLSRNTQLRALGNGVVPQQCALALRLLLPAWLERDAA